jgi:HSP20 family protein
VPCGARAGGKPLPPTSRLAHVSTPASRGTLSTVEKRRRELENAAEEIEQLFADLWQVFPFSRGMRRGYRPEADVYRTEGPPALTIVVELPGVDPNEVKVIASPQALLIAGERRRPKDCGQYQQLEIEYGPFQRQVTLAEDVDPEQATATYERGFLTIKLPIAPKPAPAERIAIVVTSR